MRRFVEIGLTLFCAGALSAQSFDVASIKPAAPMEMGRVMIGINGGPGSDDPGLMKFSNVSLTDLIQYAYDVKDYQLQGPGWLEAGRFDIQAKVPSGTTEQQARVMVRNLLAERFSLVVHHSSKEESIYALVVAKGGPKLKESAASDANASARHGTVGMTIAPGGRMRMIANGVTMAKFVEPLGMQLDRPVVDMTGLTGTYDITLDFAPDPSIMQAKMAAMGMGPPPGVGTPRDGAGPTGEGGPAATLFSALPDQLGLRLEARKGPVDLVIVDSVRKTPTEN